MQKSSVLLLLQVHHYRFCSRFEKLKDDTSSIHVSHTVNNFEFFYEPFYVSLDVVPQFDERFVGYGFTRNTQVPNWDL